MEPLKTLFTYSTPKTKATSERASVLEFFVENIKDRKGKKYRPAFIGSKLAHLSLQDLYFFKSQCLEYEKRGGEIGKIFWGSLKAK